MEIRFKREPLFEEVWSTPLTTLARKYGMSDNGIRKVCKVLAIPLPTAGHWAKIAAGQVIPKPGLPPAEGRTEFHSTLAPRPPATPELEEDEKWLAERIAFEESPENRIPVEMEPQRWHRLVTPTRSRLRELMKELEQSRRAAEKPPKPSRYPQPNLDSSSWKWKYFVRGGQVFELGKNQLPLRVTPRTYERALTILNALLFAAEARGIRCHHDDKEGRLVLTLRECAIHVRFSERLAETLRDTQHDTPLERRLEKDTIKVPTGVLRIYFSARSYSETQLQESTEAPLEQQLNEFFKRYYRAVVRERIAERERIEWNRQYEADQERRRHAEALKQQEQQQRATELQRRKNLLAEAASWKEASLLREYLDHFERKLEGKDSAIPQELKGWLIWAMQVADDIDPMVKGAAGEES